MVWRLNFALLLALALLAGCQTGPDKFNSGEHSQFSHFIGLTDFSGFARTTPGDGRVELLSPPITPSMFWDQLVVSWNASAPPGTFLEVAAAARFNSPHDTTRFFRWDGGRRMTNCFRAPAFPVKVTPTARWTWTRWF